MIHQILIPLRMFLLLTLLTGLVYPLAVTLVARVVFPWRATGSVVRDSDRAVGSVLLGQPFDDPRYFWGRPSATGPVPYNGLGGTGSNQAATNPVLVDAVRERVAILKTADPENKEQVPVDLVTASASGLDPHISPVAAAYQMSRVARIRGVDSETIRSLIADQTEQATMGILGQPRVHVLRLNRSLDGLESSQ